MNYTSLGLVAKALSMELDEQMLRHIQVIENAMLKYFGEEQKKAEEAAKKAH